MPTFSKHERLKSRKFITRLFQEGQSFIAYPLRVVWLPVEKLAHQEEDGPPAQVAISVPRRAFPSAVQRNRLKRRIREAYRLHKDVFYEQLLSSDQRIALMLVLVAREELDFAEMENGVLKMIRKFPKQLEGTES